MRCRVEPFPNMSNMQARQKIQSGKTPMEPPGRHSSQDCHGDEPVLYSGTQGEKI